MLITAAKNKKFHDYYDRVSTYGGIDKTIVYRRERQEIEHKHDINLQKIEFSSQDNNLEIERHILNFCGVFYPVYELTIVRKSPFYIYPEKKSFHYDLSFLESEELAEFKELHNKASFSWRDPKKMLKEFEACWSGKSDRLNLEYKSPILLLTRQSFKYKTILVVNPSLKDIEFFKVKDPFAAYQEISMFLGSTLAQEMKPNPENVEDKYKITNHGFDPKWSFRKEGKGK